ncbi:MAG: oxygen-independent coproporphyrinogen III oxidase [Methylophilaceae bacterium 17-44-8]|nr:MAG: oxygen-independent coproporphyrinogen III oxidase [Methylophilaceae bacterium 17-44-8]
MTLAEIEEMATEHLPHITPKQIIQYDVAGPRYTSYPTADRFVEAFTEGAYVQALAQRRVSGWTQPLSIYVHIPFCQSLCFYCACNKIITKQHKKSTEYLRYLSREIDLNVEHLGRGQLVTQLHLGGGSPTFFSDEELTELMTLIRHNFDLSAGGEYSIEIDPRTVDEKRLAHLSALGFNRLSFGVQDFDAEVQKAVHRIQPAEQVFDLMAVARKLKFDSINVDLIYGLPKQSTESFKRTLDQVVALRPDRIALYAYAHLPERFKPQRRISQYELPSATAKISMLSDAISTFMDAGYIYIGMDHFALPEDTLAVAKKQGRLHRNFQGYSTQAESDLIGLGVSSIGKIGATYSQNAKTLEEYYDHIDQGHFPVVRGLALSRDDLIRRAVIMAIMCHGELQYESIELSHMIQFDAYFADELAMLKEKEQAGMLIIEQDGIKVTEMGWFFVRAIAMVFDRYLQTDTNRARFSKII